jgi:FHS family Na+ dependent glucose MFS transporter 1
MKLMRSINRTGYLVTFGYFAACIVLGMIEASLGPIIPSLAEKTGVSLSQASLIFTTHGFGYLLGSFLGGRLYDRRPGHKILSAMMLLSIAIMVILPLINSFWILPGLFFMLGIGVGAVDVGSNTLLVWALGTAVAPFMNGLHLFFGLGTFLVPLLISAMASLSGDPGKVYWVLSLCFIPIILYLLCLPSPKMNLSSGNPMTGQERRFLITLLIALFFLTTGAEFGFGGWIYSYAIHSNLANATTAAYLNSAYWGSFSLARLISIPVAMRFRSQTILQSGMVIALASLGIIFFFPTSQGGMWLGTVGVGLGVATLFPVTLTWVGDHLRIDGRTTGYFFVGASLGTMTLPWIIGQFFESSGPQVAIIFCALDLAIALLILKGVLFYVERVRPAAVEIN